MTPGQKGEAKKKGMEYRTAASSAEGAEAGRVKAHRSERGRAGA